MLDRQKTDIMIPKLFLISLVVVTIAVTPLTSYEPFNSPKFFLLSIIAFGFLLATSNREILTFAFRTNKSLFLVIALIFTHSVIVLFTSQTPFYLQLFGADGRNTGFILYMILLISLILTYLFRNIKFYQQLINSLIIAGVLNAIYGVLQYLQLDPFNWTNRYNPVFGFFGNPNFQSAFMGITAVSIWALFFGEESKIRKRILLLFLAGLNFFIIISTDSQQGIIVYGAGLLIVIFIFTLKTPKFKKYAKYIGLGTLFSGIIAVLDIFQKLPWGSSLYKASVSERGDLWRAAWGMAVENPLTGIGFDGYGYFFREYRDLSAITERGVSITSNSAHNVFLDVLTNGGFPLLIIYLILLILVLKSAFTSIKNTHHYDPILTALVTSWICYHLQAIISINQIGIAIWGWVLGGAVLGYEQLSANKKEPYILTKGIKKGKIIIKSAIGVIVGALISAPPLLADTNFRTAIDSKQIELVLDSAYRWPQSPERMFKVAALFRQNNLLDLSAQVARNATVRFPRSYENWELLISLSNVSEVEKKQALSQMRAIDPLNLLLK